MRRRHDDRISVRSAEPVHVETVVVDANRDPAQPGRLDRGPVLRIGWVLDRDAPRAAGPEDAQDEPETLGEPRGDDDVGWISRGASDAVQVRGQRRSELRDTVTGAVGEPIARSVRERLPH